MASNALRAARAGNGENAIGWKLDPDQRRELLQQFPPKFERAVADHVTLAAKAPGERPLPDDVDAAIVGRADDGAGVEAMIVMIDGTTDRPDGSSWHITWSLADGRAERDSNDMLRDATWEMFDLPMPIQLQPARFG